MAKITYIAPGLTELMIRLPVGRKTLEIEFSQGRCSGYGSRWATFTTDDLILQNMIQQSPAYRKGKIILHKQG